MTEEMFGPYRLEALLGRGGMGEVYRAFDTVRGRVVALKRLPAALATDPEFRDRFRAEAALVARLHEPHIIPIHDFGEIDGRLFIDMRLVEGRDLTLVLAEDGPLTPRRAVHLVAQVAAALDTAHTQGLVHRDVKPGNILVTPDGAGQEGGGEFVYVADFGLARAVSGGSASLTATGATVGSIDYMAPERFTDGHGDHRVDVYSLGCLLYEALTARKPFPAEGLPAMIHAHLSMAPPRPSEHVAQLPPALDAVVARAMAKDPQDRYASAGALAAAARAALTDDSADAGAAVPATLAGHGAIPARSPASEAQTWISRGQYEPPTTGGPGSGAAAGPHPGPVRARRRRRGLVVLAALAVVLAVVGGGTLALGLGDRADPADIRTEPVRSPGDNPFMSPVGDDLPGVTPPARSGGRFSGDTSGLYGGTLDNTECDRDAMAAFLRDHPDQAAAWGAVQNISAEQVPSYLAGLTPVVLRSDTAVTNHGYDDGRATPFPAVLQAGTAVLVDEYGVPRAKCYCGNPLTPPAPQPEPRYTGPTWPGFSPESITTVQPAATAIDQFTLVNPATGEVFGRPRASTGERDQLRAPQDPVPQPPMSQDPATPQPRNEDPATQHPATQTPGTQPPAIQGPRPHHPTSEVAAPPAGQPPAPALRAPEIVGVSSYTEGVLIYLSIRYVDADGDAVGFAHEWLIVQGHKPAVYTFSEPSFGRVSPGRVDYPFNHACGQPNEYESDVEFWIYDSKGHYSKSIIAHLSCP